MGNFEVTSDQQNHQPRPQQPAIFAEAARWQTIMGLSGEKTIDVYLDLKSPHAYLAVRPTLALARDYKVRLNFLPYMLSYVSLGVSTDVQEDMKRRPPNPSARPQGAHVLYHCPSICGAATTTASWPAPIAR